MKTLQVVLVLALAMGCRPKDKATPTPGASADSTAPTPSSPTPDTGTEFLLYKDLVRLNHPLTGQLVTSPLTVEGAARGSWFFEASFPVILLGAGGDTLAIKPAQAQGEWMTSNFVPFKVVLDFTATGDSATLVLKKDNASGLPEHDDELRLPLRLH